MTKSDFTRRYRGKRKRVLLIILAVMFVSGVHFSLKGQQEIKSRRAAAARRQADWRRLERRVRRKAAGFRGTTGIVIKDLKTGREISWNKERLFPSASLVKVPVMFSCFYAAHQGRLRLNERLTFRPADRTGGSGNLKCQPAGAELTVQELMELMIVYSDNTATNMLVDRLGGDYLNDSFRKLGFKNTNLSRKMMDFRSRRKGIENYTTAADIAGALEKIYRKEFLGPRVSKRCLDLLRRQQVNDRIPAALPKTVAVAHKTGLERSVCHDAGIVFTGRGDFLICVLTRNRGDGRAAKHFISDLSLDVYNYYAYGR